MGQNGAYQQLWRVVDGAVTDCFKNHPDYLTWKGRRSAQGSLVKRVTGTVLSFAVQQTARGRRQAAETGRGAITSSAPEAVGVASSTALHSHAHVEERCYQAIRMALFQTGSRREVRKDARSYRSAFKATTSALKAIVGPPGSPKAREAIRRAAIGRAVA